MSTVERRLVMAVQSAYRGMLFAETMAHSGPELERPLWRLIADERRDDVDGLVWVATGTFRDGARL